MPREIMTASQCASCRKALGIANDARLDVEFLESISPVYPGIADDVERLRARLDNLTRAAKTALEINDLNKG